MSELDMFIDTCTDGVHPETISAIIEIASQRDPFTLTTLPYKGARSQMALADRDATIRKGVELIENDTSISVGYMQVSSRYWLLYDVTVMDMLEPCTNIQVGSLLLKEAYEIAFSEVGDQHRAMRLAVERYVEGNLYMNGKESVVKLFGDEQPQRMVDTDTSSWSEDIRVAGFDQLKTRVIGTGNEGG